MMRPHNDNPAISGDGVTRQLPLERAQARLAAIVECSDDAIIGKDLDGIITDWNLGAEKIFGYTSAEIVGASILRLIPETRQAEENFILGRIRSGQKVEHFETMRRTKDGRLIPVSITASPIKDAQGNIIGASKIARDISRQKAHERELLRMAQLYSALSQVNQAIVWSATRDELFQRVCRVLTEQGGFHMAWIGWHDPETHRILPLTAAGKEPNYLQTVKVYGDDRPEGRGPTGQAFRTGRPYICNDMRHNPVTAPWREQLAQRGFQSSTGFPIRLKKVVVGVLTVYSDEPFFFRDQEIALLDEAAGDISFALDNFADKEARQQIELMAQNERRFSATMIESMPGIVYFYDDQGRFLRWNRNFEVVSGYSGGEIARMHPLDFFPETEKETLQQRIAEVFDRGESSLEASFRTKDGRALPYFFTGRRVMFDGKPCLVGMGVDISQRKQALQGLREAQEQLETVIENLREGMVIADPAGEWVRWNPAALRMLGFADLEEGRRQQHEFPRIFQLFTLENAPLPPEQWPLARVRRGELLNGLELRVRRTGEDWEGIFSYAGTLARYGGEKTLAFMTVRDITSQKQAEMALRVLNKTLQLEVVNRTEELQAALVRAEAADQLKSAFLATMSHELRTPLNSIIGFTGIILQGLAGPLNAEQTKQLGMVRSSARHLLELINDVLDISKIEAGQLEVRLEPMKLVESVERVAGLVRPLAEKKRLALVVNLAPGLGEITSDRRRVEQILLNLLNNAIKFTEQGSVTLLVDESPAGPAVRFRVVDTGIGIKPADIAALFQPFRQLDAGISRQHEGTGLGLAICRKLAVLLGGEISVTSEWTKGSEFTVIIPKATPVSA
jgi:PAS domain S-box-containing protein